MAKLHSLRLLGVLLIAVTAEPSPGRIPKVYNALITSNQNLEPSKAYPVYQPVLHDAFAYSVPSIYYGGDFPIGNGILPPAALLPKEPQPQTTQPPAASNSDSNTESPTDKEAATPEPSDATGPEPATSDSANSDGNAANPPPSPQTESPIPLNEFGLPPQVLPLGRINPAFHGYTHISPFTYSYPGIRLYDPFDPFNLSPYGFPVYRSVPNFLRPSVALFPAAAVPKPEAPAGGPTVSVDQSSQTPPPEPSDLNVLNYSSKDPAIPNVPPPPLPQSGLKSDKSE